MIEHLLKKITITFTGAYSGNLLSQTESKEIKYKISKSAFKNNILIDDAFGKMAMVWDNIYPEIRSYGKAGITIQCLLTPSNIPTTKVTLSPSLTSEISKSLNDYCSPQAPNNPTIKFSKTNSESKDYLKIEIDGLPDEVNHGYAITVPNKAGAVLFENLPANYGLKFSVKRDVDEEEYSLDDESKVIFDKIQ